MSSEDALLQDITIDKDIKNKKKKYILINFINNL